MRAIASGVSAAGTLALVQHLLALSEPRLGPSDLAAVCGNQASSFDITSFVAGVFVGLVVFAAIEGFVTLRWCLIQLINEHLASRQSAREVKKPLYKFIDGPEERD